MSSRNDRELAIQAATRSSALGRRVVGRLLDPVEMSEVVGANSGSCNPPGGNHNMSPGGGSFNQSGGNFTQSGGSYTMNCPPVKEQ